MFKMAPAPILKLATALVLAGFIIPVAADINPRDLESKVDQLVASMQTEIDALPGLSIVVVQNEKELFRKGYGVANTTTQVPFTADTLSYLASGTKSFVGLAVAILAEQGELDLDRPVGPTYLADLDQEQLGIFAGTTLRQLLTHTHGLEAEPVELRTAYTGNLATGEIWKLLGQMQPSESGDVFDYSNFGYVAASYVLEHFFGEPWQNIVERLVLAPAGMDDTVFKVSDLLDRPYASPHRWRGSTQPVPVYKRDNTMHAAGGNFTTVGDLSRWLRLNLNDGALDGKQVWPAAAVQLIRAPLTSMEQEFYEFQRKTYGLGWYDSDYDGERLFHHFGSFTGYRAHISMMPEVGMGVAILANDFSPPTAYLPDMIASYIYDLALAKPLPEEKYAVQIAETVEKMAPYRGRTMPERPRNAPSDESSFAGVYESERWGVIELRNKDGVLRFHWGNAVSDLIYLDEDEGTFMRFELSGDGYLAKLIRNDDGDVSALGFRGYELRKRDQGD